MFERFALQDRAVKSEDFRLSGDGSNPLKFLFQILQTLEIEGVRILGTNGEEQFKIFAVEQRFMK